MSSTEYKSYFQYTRHFFQPFHSVIPLRKYSITISLMGYSIMDRVKSVEEKQTQPMEWAHDFARPRTFLLLQLRCLNR